MSNYDPGYSMKWHKFLIYFSLWLSAVVNSVNAIRAFNGSIYGSSSRAELVYLAYPGMKAITLIYGVALLGLAVLAIATRFALAGYKANGPRLLIILYILNLVVGLGFLILASMVSHIPFSNLADASTWASIIISIIMIAANKTYYDKRDSLFVN